MNEAPPDASTPLAARPGTPLREHLLAVGLVAAASGVALLFRSHLATIDVAMLLLLSVVGVAARCGRPAALLASVLSIVSFDVLFVPPYYRLSVEDGAYLLTFAVMLIVGFVMSHLTATAREAAIRHESARALVEAERLRTALLSSLSHDLRSPLASIEGAASSLAADTGSTTPETRRELAETVLEESRRMHRLVTNLLDMVRVESGTLQVQATWLPLEEVIGVALIRLDDRLEDHSVTVTLSPALPLVLADELLLEQVFINLLDNAIRHTPPGTPIAVRAWAEDGAVTVEVADEGPGIAPGEEDAIFGKFHRVPRQRLTPPAPGAGLGLTICQGIIRAHGGRIWVVRGTGSGAVFRFTLPLRGTPPEALPAEPGGEAP